MPASRVAATARATLSGSWVRSSVASTCGTADCMPIETRVNPPAASSASDSGVTESGLASVVTSASGASPKRSRMPPSILTRSPDLSIVGVPPPTKTVDTDGDSSPSTRWARSISRSAASA